MIDVVQHLVDMGPVAGLIVFLSSCLAACLVAGFLGMGDDFND